MRVLSLFSGIGGIDLGLERAGHTVVAQSEVDPYCCRVLAKHWPDIPNLGDVTTIDWNAHHGLGIELVAGGYPCQPFSLAGSRQGDRDPRHLWPYMLNAIRVLRPRYAVMENVPGHLSMGFGRVLGDLAEIGFDVEWDCIPAAAVGAPHRRDRVWIIATHPDRNGEPVVSVDALPRSGVMVPDSHPSRRLGWTGQSGTRGWPEPADCGWWEPQPDICRVAHGVPHRVDRLRGLGNAVVPQVAEHIGRMLTQEAAA